MCRVLHLEEDKTMFELYIYILVVFDNSVLSNVYHFDQINTLISQFLVFDNLTFLLAF